MCVTLIKEVLQYASKVTNPVNSRWERRDFFEGEETVLGLTTVFASNVGLLLVQGGESVVGLRPTQGENCCFACLCMHLF